MEKQQLKELTEALKELHPNAKCELNFSSPFELLVAVILSAQCTDKRVNMVTDILFKKYNTPEAYAALDNASLEQLIYSAGFYKSKAESIISMSKDIVSKFGGKVPSTMEELLTLRGVGRKTASVVLSVAFGVPAMPVDTHVFRVSRRLGLSSGKTPEAVERDLMKIFPKEEWGEAHHLLIFHGRYICKAQKPLCANCTLKGVCKEKRG